MRPPVVSLLSLLLLTAGCSTKPQPAAEKAAPPAAEAAAADEATPQILRTAWKGDFDEIVKRRVVRVLVPFHRPEFFFMDGKPAGVLNEVFQEVERVLNTKLKTGANNRVVVTLLPTPIDKLRERMSGGYGDIAAFGISITPENQQLVDFTIPTMTGVKIVPVTGPGAPELKQVEDLSGKEVWIYPGSRMARDLAALNEKLKAQGKPPAVARETDAILEPGDIMEMVNNGTYPIALMQSVYADFWSGVFDAAKPRPDLAIAQDVELGWALHKNTPKLKAFLDEFIKTHGMGTAFGNTVIRRYFKDAKYAKNATNPNELRKFTATAPFFRKYADKYDIDFLMMVAQGYQESQLDQNVKSPVGAIGIMQVMPATAASPPVKVADIHQEENNIHAGIRLMHFLIEEHFNEPGLDRVNRTLFAIAAYNAGPARITKCRAMAKDMGYDPNKWFGNTEVAVAKVVGRETTQYVANIYKYYLGYRMAREIRDRRQEARKKAS